MAHVVSATEARVHWGELMRRAVQSGEPIIVERDGRSQVVVLSVDEYKRLVTGQQAGDWKEGVRRARAQVQADMDGRALPPPEQILEQLREERDEQLLAVR